MLYALSLVQLATAPAEAGFTWVASGCGARCTYNSNGKDPSIEEVGTGHYRVWMPGQTSNQTQALFASAGYHALNGEICKLGEVGWSLFSDDFVADVLCFDANGEPVSFPFVLAYRGEALLGEEVAWARADKSDVPYYLADPEFSFNPRGVSTIRHTAPGSYEVEFEAMAADGVALVTAAGDGPERCSVAETYKGNKGVVISVLCVDPWGNQADTNFYLTWTRQTTFSSTAPTDADAGAHLWADAPYYTAPYEPYPLYSWNGRGAGPAKITRLGTGLYDVLVRGMGTDDEVALVTAYSVDGATCQPSTWNGTHVTVMCQLPGGKPWDSQFVLSLQQPM